jgi:hypothetical protein
MDELMDSDDEIMFATQMEEEAEISVADDEEHLMTMSFLMELCAHTDTKPRRGGLVLGLRKSKSRQRLEGCCILYADYFADEPIARRGGISAPFADEAEALPRHCLCCSTFRQLFHMQEGLH